MGIITWFKETPNSLRATVEDTKNEGPVSGLVVSGSRRFWKRTVDALKSIGSDIRR